MTDIVDIVNQALREVGWQRPIAEFYEGSRAARVALDIFGQTRDELLDAGEWPFARRANVALTLLKGPPPPGGYDPGTPWNNTYPPPGWLYEYLYPDDMLELRAILPSPGAMWDLNPQPQLWRVDNDNSLVDNAGQPTAQKKVILCNVAGALATYSAQITDPNLWEPGFIATLVKALKAKFALALQSGNALDLAKTAESEMAAIAGRAEPARG